MCPVCGLPPIGTLETVTGLALLTPSESGPGYDYEGETKIWWDEQKTVRDKSGHVTLVCNGGHDWRAEEL